MPWAQFVFGMLGGLFLLPGAALIALMLATAFCLWRGYRWAKYAALLTAFISAALFATIAFNVPRSDVNWHWNWIFTGDRFSIIALPLVASAASLAASVMHAGASRSA